MYLMTDPEKGLGKEVLLNDTIGFIRDLPPHLVKAFSSTLEDSIESDLLLHVVDISDPFVEEKMEVVNSILDDIGAKQKRILVFNKIDKLDKKRLSQLKKIYPDKDVLWISIAKDLGIEVLKKHLISYVKGLTFDKK
jgi:GTP-binding protein HflX